MDITQNVVDLFEIPVTDMDRAIKFYEREPYRYSFKKIILSLFSIRGEK